MLLEYLEVISLCGFVAKGYGYPISFATVWNVGNLIILMPGLGEARAASAHVWSGLASDV